MVYLDDMKIQGKIRKMDLTEETNQLIKKIEQYPVIWNMKHSDYRNIPARRKCWEEITESFAPAKVSQTEKEALSAHLQNRWKNIRDRFSRTTRFGGKKKQYVYSSKLKFLLNSVSFRKSKSRIKFDLSKTKKAKSAAAKVLRESKRPSPKKRSRIGNGLEAPTSKEASSASLGLPVVPEKEAGPVPGIRARSDNGLEASLSKNIPSASLDLPEVPEKEARQSPEKSTQTDRSLESPLSKNTPSASLEILDVLEKEVRPVPEKRTDSSLEAPMSESTPAGSLDIPDVPAKEARPVPEKRARTDSCLEALMSQNSPSILPDILDASERESKPRPAKRTRTDSGLVETKLIGFLERNMAEFQDITKNNQDEDRLFLLSLQTSFKSIQPVYKLKAKIEILSVLDKYQQIYEESNVVQPQIVEVMHSVTQ